MTRTLPLRVGIAGAGLMGRWHAHAAAQAGARVAAICDSDPVRASQLAARYRGCDAVDAFDRLVAACDVVHICTPTATHSALARRALEAGRHAMVEKPVAPNAGKMRDLLELADARGLLLCPVYQFLFQDGVRQARAALREIAPLRHIDVTICSAGAEGADAETRERVVREILPHPLSLLQSLLPSGVSGVSWTVQSPAPGELRAMGRSGDITTSLLLSMSGRPTANRMRVIGERATIELDLFHGFAVVNGGAVSRMRKLTRPFAESASTAAAAGANLLRRAWHREPAYPGLARLVQEFHTAIVEGRPSPIPAADAIAIAGACDRLARCSQATVSGADPRGLDHEWIR